jgi:hypothetical protein
MSTSPEPISERDDDRIVNLLSRWLARHVDDDELRRVVTGDPGELSAEQAAAVGELRDALTAEVPRSELEVAVRETLEALALG